MSYQKIVIVGNLGADVRYGQAGTEPVINFNVAVTEKWNKAVVNRQTRQPEIQKMERTTWFQCAAFGQRWQAVAQYLRKGTQVLIESDRIEAKYYPDKNTGVPVLTLNLTVADIKLLGSPRDQSGSAVEAEAAAGDAPDYFAEMAAAGDEAGDNGNGF